jgi:hypothetical protein
MRQLETSLLARDPGAGRLEALREDIQDALKEYGELDLIVELLQNALDALDRKRYINICEAAQKEPDSRETIQAWNKAVLRTLAEDYRAYAAATTATQRSLLYQQWKEDARRQQLWWEALASEFGVPAESVSQAATRFEPRLTITVRLGPPIVIELEDNGVGIHDIATSFMHKSSEKRTMPDRPRRLGVRGNHGWGLTAVLGFSRRVEVLSRSRESSLAAFLFEGYSDFATDPAVTPSNYELDLTAAETEHLSERLRNQSTETGTDVRIHLAQLSATNPLGYSLANFSRERFKSLLQLYTPIGQVNDYVLHPAYHTLRKNDLRIDLVTVGPTGDHTERVDFDTFRFSGRTGLPHYEYDSYVNAGWPRGASVHTVHRAKRGDDIFLLASDIQPAEWVHKLQSDLEKRGALPMWENENGEIVGEVPRGFQFALSGGMRSEWLARPPRSTTAAFRGIVLSEVARPTLGRKYVLDQRSVIPRVAQEFETEYDDLRKKLRPTSEPPPASPAAAKWRREFHESVRSKLESQCPPSQDLCIWAGEESREARIMLLTGELVGRGVFGDLKILRAHLQEIYDFSFLYRSRMQAGPIPSTELAAHLARGGYAERRGDEFIRYGIGEFKADGEDLLDDFDETDPRKMPDTPDLLVCWDFDEQTVQDQPWVVELATVTNSEFPGQTHLWTPGVGVRRERPLPVIALKRLLEHLIGDQRLGPAPAGWPEGLPPVYY